MTQRVRAQVQAVEMTARQLAAIRPSSMRGGFMPMPVGGETVVSGRFGNLGQTIVKRKTGDREDCAVNLAENIEPSLTLKGGEGVGMAGRVLETDAVRLKNSESSSTRCTPRRRE